MDSPEQDIAKQALGALLKPLARLMVESGLPLGQAVEELKSALVDAAYANNPTATASHVSLVTGVHRKDIRRLDSTSEPTARKTVSAERVLSIWMHDPEFCDASGTPLALPRTGQVSFEGLARRAKVDTAVSTVLSVLQDAGCVQVDEDVIRFVSGSLVPQGHEDKLRAAVATLVPHLSSAVGNLAGDAPQFDQALRYSHLSSQAVDELEAAAARMAKDMLNTLNALAFELQQKEDGSHLFVTGVYTHIEDKGS